MVYFLNYFNSDVWNILRSRNDNLVCVTQDDSKVHFQSKIILTGEVRVLTPFSLHGWVSYLFIFTFP